MRLPIGYDNFKVLVDNKFDFVDKTLLIKELLDDSSISVSLITRPRRFGKTLNLSMLHCFLSSEVGGQPTQGLFDGLKIAKEEGDYMQQQGKYPVIFITFKSVKDGSFEHAFKKMTVLISELYKEHRYLLSNEQLMPEDKVQFQEILEKKAEQATLEKSLQYLTKLLYQHHGVKPWLLIDEYDSSIQSAYLNGYYNPMANFMRGLFGDALKTNDYLERAVITGILRVSKESLFSGLNNIKVYSLLNSRYSEYFGFTEPEVNSLLTQGKLEDKKNEIQKWYNGYKFGNTVIYNPWSIVNCIQGGGELEPYWVNTSDNQLIRDLLVNSEIDFKMEFESLLLGKRTTQLIDENMAFGDLAQKGDSVWSLLLMSGYLKAVEQLKTTQGTSCTLDIPNLEVRRLYQQIIERWLSSGHGIQWYNRFLESLLTGDIPAFERGLSRIMEETVSYHDISTEPEAFYHGFMLGVTATLYENKNYEVRSNRESGYGRYDYLILSHDLNRPTILFEFKQLGSKGNSEPEKLDPELEQLAGEALTQINKKNYVVEARQAGIKRIIKIGIGFCGKRFKLKSESEDLG